MSQLSNTQCLYKLPVKKKSVTYILEYMVFSLLSKTENVTENVVE